MVEDNNEIEGYEPVFAYRCLTRKASNGMRETLVENKMDIEKLNIHIIRLLIADLEIKKQALVTLALDLSNEEGDSDGS